MRSFPPTLEEAEELEWGTYGLEAVENHAVHGTPLPPLQHKRLGDLEDDHLKRILMGQRPDAMYSDAIKTILRARADDADDRHLIRRRDAVEATKAQVSSDVADKNGKGD